VKKGRNLKVTEEGEQRERKIQRETKRKKKIEKEDLNGPGMNRGGGRRGRRR
jgi:hypothetical protein